MREKSEGIKNLEPKWQKRYRIMRLTLYVLFILLILIFGYKTLFPSKQFIFFFKTPQASKNNLDEPRKKTGEIYRNGKILAADGLVFDSPLEELESDYSRIKIKLILEKNNQNTLQEISVRKSYRSFFYPEGKSVSDEEFEQLKNTQNTDFLESPLFSYGDAVYITDGKTVRPFNSVDTFLSLGYDWTDVHPAGGDEFMKYEKGKLFTAANPNPDGTIFVTRESSQYYIVENGEKRKIENPRLLEKNIRRTPIMADEVSIDVKNQCNLNSSWSLFNSVYTCQISIENLKPLLGNDYQFELSASGDFKIKEAGVIFDKSPNWSNMKNSLIDIRKRIIQNYVPQNQ
jgi:hypothetical protein